MNGCLREAASLNRTVLCEVEASFQSGKIVNLRDAIDDHVPADLLAAPGGLYNMSERLRNMLLAAIDDKLFGVVKLTAAVNGPEVLAFRCRRERSTK